MRFEKWALVRHAVVPHKGGGGFIERCLAAVTAATRDIGPAGVERSAVYVRSVVCAHFVSDYFWQILADFWH